MPRYIDADKLIDNVENWIDSLGNPTFEGGSAYHAELLGCIEDTPTVEYIGERVELIRGADGLFRQKITPYTTIECRTKEEYDLIIKALEEYVGRRKPMEEEKK